MIHVAKTEQMCAPQLQMSSALRGQCLLLLSPAGMGAQDSVFQLALASPWMHNVAWR